MSGGIVGLCRRIWLPSVSMGCQIRAFACCSRGAGLCQMPLARRQGQSPSGRDFVRADRDPRVRQGRWVAAWYCSTTLAGMRPRALTAMPACFAHARMLPLRSRLAAVRPGRRRCPRPALRA
jgi:hypothetical protein